MMRLALTMSFLTLTVAPCLAQSDDFNPYQAVLDGMPLAEAEPLIVAAYGDISNRSKGILGKEDEAVLVFFAGTGEPKPMFVFCNDRLAAASAAVTAAQAAAILRPFTSVGSDNIAYPHDNGVWFHTADELLSIDYMDVGTKTSMIMLTYPQDVMLNFNFDDHCAEVAD